MSLSSPSPDAAGSPAARGSPLEVLLAFFRLGLMSFGGPVAHLGYFRNEFVARRRWLDDQAYSDLVALCQFLPGPASSQVGFALGLQRAGWLGGLAAWVAFTLPSALLLMAFAYGAMHGSGPLAAGLGQGLMIAAVAVVAQAVWGMGRALCPDRPRAGLAVGAALLALAWPGSGGQLAAILGGAVFGAWKLAGAPAPALREAGCPVSPRQGVALLGVCALLLLGLPWLAFWLGGLALPAVATVFQAGALVFGGGHVVLPLLEAGVVETGWVGEAVFLAGYGAAQAVPGPLFSFAAYLGMVMPAPFGGWLGGLVLLVAVFAPGLLLVAGVLPFWERWRRHALAPRILAGVNAAVVGILLAALYDPVWTSAITDRAAFAVGLAAFWLLVVGRAPPLLVVAGCALAGVSMALV